MRKQCGDQSLFRWGACCLVVVFLFLFTGPAVSWGAALSFQKTDDDAGSFQLSLIVDQVERLAGLKISLVYDKDAIKFVKAAKTKETVSLMSVVNDKIPGKMIIVMAGAQGISGENIPLITLHFIHLASEKTKKPSVVRVTGLQLMSDDLKEIKGSKPEFRIRPFVGQSLE